MVLVSGGRWTRCQVFATTVATLLQGVVFVWPTRNPTMQARAQESSVVGMELWDLSTNTKVVDPFDGIVVELEWPVEDLTIKAVTEGGAAIAKVNW